MKETSNADFTLFAGFGGGLAAAGFMIFYSSTFGATGWDAAALLSGMLSFLASAFLTVGVATLGADILESTVTMVLTLVVSANISAKSF